VSSIDVGKQHAVLVWVAEAETLCGDQRRELADVPALLVPKLGRMDDGEFFFTAATVAPHADPIGCYSPRYCSIPSGRVNPAVRSSRASAISVVPSHSAPAVIAACGR
jgi:hypothetical protein